MHQVRQDAELVTGQPHRRAVVRDFRRSRIERHRSAPELRGDLPARAPDERAEPREHFLHPERLCDVVVRSAVDAVDLFVPAAAGREHEHRHGQPRVAPAPEDREPVHLRQAEVEHDRVVALGLREEVPAGAVGRAVDGVPRLPEGHGQLRRNPRFVFDDEHPHSLVIAHSNLNGT
jgi:hypothetical protein